MVCTIEPHRPGVRRQRIAGVTLSEYLVAMFITCLIVLAICSLALFNGRSFAAYASYVDLDLANRNTLNQLVKDFRNAKRVTSATATKLVVQDLHSNVFEYAYDPTAQTLSRTKDGKTTKLLTSCNRLSFIMKKPNLTNGTLNFYPATNVVECKAITVNWCAYRTYLGAKSDDLPQTATIVMRN